MKSSLFSNADINVKLFYAKQVEFNFSSQKLYDSKIVIAKNILPHEERFYLSTFLAKYQIQKTRMPNSFTLQGLAFRTMRTLHYQTHKNRCTM